MKCETCNGGRAEVIISWRNSKSVALGAVCECCACGIWDNISTRFSGTSADHTFTCIPYDNREYRLIKAQVDEMNEALANGSLPPLPDPSIAKANIRRIAESLGAA
jgi:protein-arginine kinase activator protein McsA